MAYTSKTNRPNEFANKTNHSHFINDKIIKEFLDGCELPKEIDEISLESDGNIVDFEEPSENPIKYIIAVDGGYTEVEVRKSFPSAKVAFFQFGAFFLKLEDWNLLEGKPFISPEDMAQFRDLARIKLVLPTQIIKKKNEKTFADSVRRTIYDFFVQNEYIETLKWFIFEEYNTKSSPDRYVSTNPYGGEGLTLIKSEMNSDFTFDIDGQKIYLTDVFRFHEKIDEHVGATGIIGNLATLIEQIIIVDSIKIILKNKPALLNQMLFIKDGVLAFFDVTARLHSSMRKMLNYLSENHNIYLVGLEKSGVFVEHATQISGKNDKDALLKRNQILLLSNDYIRNYLISGDNPYGGTSYYSGKVIFKSGEKNLYVINLPTKEYLENPTKSDYKNLDIILYNLNNLKCYMYDDALIPITFANKLVSLADQPSKVLLERFAQSKVS